jgi:hypothetical protein
MIVEKQMECRLAGETEVLGENLPQCHFGPSQNPATNRLSYRICFKLNFPALSSQSLSSDEDIENFYIQFHCK